MSDEDEWAALMALTELRQAIGKLNGDVTIEDPIDIVGIPAENTKILQPPLNRDAIEMNYRSEWTQDLMNHANFDWLRLKNCFRQTVADLQVWVAESGLELRQPRLQRASIGAIASVPAFVAI